MQRTTAGAAAVLALLGLVALTWALPIPTAAGLAITAGLIFVGALIGAWVGRQTRAAGGRRSER